MTPTEERCELTELVVSQCAHCKKQKSVDEEMRGMRMMLLGTGRWIPASFPGRCVGCGEPYRAGLAIQRREEGWAAECCHDEEF